MTPRIITVILEGGVIHDIQDIPEGTVVRVIDSDIDGVEPEEIEEINGEELYVTYWGHSVSLVPQ